ncbi:MAG: IPT/TIG domain-containing protein [Caldilineaceae bacterium]|nr:IPT/TIG domain-containing protein [Caldilineaceae bacterium]
MPSNLRITLLLVVVSLLLAAFFRTLEVTADEPISTIDQPAAPTTVDLAVESLVLSPPNPHTTVPATMTVIVRNVGTESVAGRRVYLYIDPVDRPPTKDTPATKEFVVGVVWPAGDSMTVEYAEFTFTTSGCNHVVYAVVDPLELIAESDETNNRAQVDVCVEPEVPGAGSDTYEPDNECATASAIAVDGIPQRHNFSPKGNMGDVDWVKFQVTKDVTYTVTAAGIGAQAWPTISLADSCGGPPPGAFGTTSRLEIIAPSTGTYYLQIENSTPNGDPLDYDPFESSYLLKVQSEGGIAGPLPAVATINPSRGFNDRNTNMTLTGANFSFPVMVEFCPYQTGICKPTDCVQLLDASWINSQQLIAIVQANLKPGDYCASVTNDGGRRGFLPRAFTILSGPPELQQTRPNQAYGDVATDVHIYGFNFADGLQVAIGPSALENLQVINRTHALGVLPQGLAAGDYDVSASYPGGAASTLNKGYTVLAPNDDLYGQSQELWVEPVAPRAEAAAQIGMMIHRKGGDAPLSNLLVRFSVNGTLLGDGAVALLAPDGQAGTERVVWTPSAPGDYTLVAQIDPTDLVKEGSEANNVVTRTVTVLPPAADRLAPRVDNFVISGDVDTVTSTLVYLDATASDLPNPGGSGVADVRYVEFEYSQGTQLWVQVQDSDWISYTTNHISKPWTLTPVGGNHYIQAWARDVAGNISVYPAQDSVNYLPPTEFVARNQARIYRRTLAVGETLNVQMQPVSGDADLYIWPPDWQAGRPPWVSNLSSSAVESLVFQAKTAGVYQIEIYGYSSARYQLTIQSHTAASRMQLGVVQPGGEDPNKAKPVTPVLDPQSEPPRNVPQTVPPTYRIYLPAATR